MGRKSSKNPFRPRAHLHNLRQAYATRRHFRHVLPRLRLLDHVQGVDHAESEVNRVIETRHVSVPAQIVADRRHLRRPRQQVLYVPPSEFPAVDTQTVTSGNVLVKPPQYPIRTQPQATIESPGFKAHARFYIWTTY